MEFDELLPYILIGAIIWAIIMYLIISGAVRSGTKSQTAFLRMLFRMKAKEMKKQGFTYDQIKEIYLKPEEEFWESLAKED